ncbi:TPA: hypothetical protein QC153_001093 [Bacillus cereus]|uniref:hypothetical protein n=1 Tax=Bacillus cereus TaxID=1396 RepID=UPI000789F1E3|nr:hypothetical protein B4079_2643 [Bacillus cereus]MBL3853318.1 hypothetical protein [Bacillus cereus]HDR8301760.1 hypothetical protein [Bacillus cereus]HDX9585766.1 hypothetical protein [Bacillus cereus]
MEIDIYGRKFDVTTVTEGNHKKVMVQPNLQSIGLHAQASEILDKDTVQFLWSKAHFGIKNRTAMFKILYDTYEDVLSQKEIPSQEQSSHNQYFIDRSLTLQALFCDMIIRLGITVEEFAAICSAIEEHKNHGTNIIDSYLVFTDPMGFYNSITAKGGTRTIKKIFNYPESKFDYKKIFSDLSDEELDLVWKATNITAEYILDGFKIIAESIKREVNENFTLYDMYNKLKHAFAPIYPYATPGAFTLEKVPLDANEEELIKHFLFENVTIMHAKLPEKKTTEEKQKDKKESFATPTLTRAIMDESTVSGMMSVIKSIEFLYTRLVKTYIAYSQGSFRISFILPENSLTEDEKQIISNIIDIE